MTNDIKQACANLRIYRDPVKEGDYEDLSKVVRACLAENDAIVFTDDQCFFLNANQHRGDIHPYTCGNDSRHRPLIATRQGWRCADCDYRQNWAHGIPLKPAESEGVEG